VPDGEEHAVARTPRASVRRTTPVQQAERARQVVTVLGRIEDRMVADHRNGDVAGRPHGSTSLMGVIDEASRDAWPGVDDDVACELAGHLPAPLRSVGSHRPRMALALYDGLPRDHGRVLDLVRTTHRELGGAPRHPSATGRREPC
jgi:hypothetical protein